MPQVRVAIASGAKNAWWWLRQVMGDAGYENYLRSLARRSLPGLPCEKSFLTREEFYLDALLRRYSSMSRCC